MGNYQEVRDQVYGFFIQEAPELVQSLESELLLLRTERTKARVHNLMRAAHSLKGGAANVGLTTIQSLAHRLEDFFRCFYDECLVLTPDLEHLLLKSCDHLRDTLMATIELGEAFDGDVALHRAEPLFRQIEEILGAFLQTQDVLPTLGDSGLDMARILFEVDVSEALAHLDQVAADPQHPLAAGELRAQAEVFMGLGELLSLSWLTEMAQITLKALDQHPQRAHEILRIALDNFRAAQQTVLSGYGSEGIPTSVTLKRLAEQDVYSWSEGSQPSAEAEEVFSGSDGSQFLPEAVSSWPEGSHLSVEEVFSLSEGSQFSAEDIFSWPEGSQLPNEAVLPSPEGSQFSAEEVFSLPEGSQFPDDDEFSWVEDPTIEPIDPLDQELFTLSPRVGVSLQELSELPSIEILSETPSPPDTSQTSEPINASPTQQKHSTSDPHSSISVRLDLARLEQMNNQLGELAILHNKLSLQNEQLQDTLQILLARFKAFLRLGNQLKLHMDQLVLSPTQITQARRLLSLGDQVMGFDTLELDSYNEVYTLLQSAVDQIGQMEEGIGDVALLANQSSHDLDLQRQMQTTLRNELMWARMLPLGDILNRFPRVLRDLSHQYQKPVELKLSGTSVLVDKAILERLYVPLTHLVRNAFDHGIEGPGIRQYLQKPAVGQISIHAYYRGSRTIIEVTDDGQGIDLEKVKHKALRSGLISPEEAAQVGSQRLFELLFEPNFSTASTITEISGRGMGLDIVRSQIQTLKGTLSVTSKPGLGTTVTLQFPLTLRISKLLVIWTGACLIATPSDTLEEIVVPQPQQLIHSANQRFLHWRERAIPIYELRTLLSYASPPPEWEPSASLRPVPTPKHWLLPLLVIRQGLDYVALEVEQLLTEQELVIKPLSPALPYPTYFYGCTITGDGTLIPVIDGLALLSLRQTEATSGLVRISPSSPPEASQPLIQIVDDSVGMRQTLTLTLEKAGYQVLAACQGREALDQLQHHPNVRLVICDIEMPMMNGFEFLIQKREDPTLRTIPVVMLTSRSSEKHRTLALQLGAMNYFTKPYIVSEFLQEIDQILSSTLA